MNFSVVLNQVLILFLLMFVGGFWAAKKGMFDDAGVKTLSTVVVNFGLSGLVISSIFGGQSVDSLTVIKIILVSSLMYVPPLVMAILMSKTTSLPKQQEGVYSFMLLFGNAGFMGYPMVGVVFGEEGLFYASLCGIPFYLLVYSIGIYYMSMGQGNMGVAGMLKKLRASMPFMAAVISVVLYLLRVPCPAVIVRTAKYMADMSTPLSMMVIGATLSEISPASIFKNYRLYAVSAARLLLTPLATYFLATLFLSDPLVIGVVTLISAMPVAANCTMLAVEYQSDARLSSEGVFLSTLLSALTIPLVASFL